MQKFEKLMLPITLVLIAILGWIFLGELSSNNQQETNTEKNVVEKSAKTYDTKSGEMGAVMVEVTPTNPSRYSISFNTHSVNLDFEFKNIIKLEDNNGNVYKPVSWSGERGGHHVSGEMQFSTVNPNAEIMKLTITEIENEMIIFDWSVK